MSAPAIVWLCVAVATLVILTAFLIQLVRQVRRLAASVIEFQKDVKPVLETIQRDTASAQERAEKVQERADALQALREGDGRPGARTRR
jgi:hypothetical protein